MGWEHVIPQLSTKLAVNLQKNHKNSDLNIQGNGQATRSFIHISDFIDGLMLIWEKGVQSEIYHIGTDEEIKIIDLAQLILKTLESKGEIITGPEPLGATRKRCPDIKKLNQLGYQPKVNISKGLPDVVKWYSDNLDLCPGDKFV
jgi:nucleoside-diphosphate-sugar epimerase